MLRFHYVPLVRSGASVWAAGVAVSAAVLSGCTTTVTGTATPAESGSASSGAGVSGQAPKAAPDASQIDGTVLRLTDLPAGWSTVGGPGPDQQTMQSVSSCLGARDSWKDVAAVSDPPGFQDTSGNQVGSFAASYHSQRDVDGDAALFRDSRASSCFGHAFDSMARTSVPAGTRIGTSQFTVVAGSGGGPSNVAGVAIGTLPVTTVYGRDTTIYIEFVLITGRMTEAQLFFLSNGEPLAADLLSNAISAVAQRVAAL